MFKSLKFWAALLCSTMLNAQQPNNQNQVEPLDEIVLLDSKFHLKRENSGKVIVKISQDDIQKSSGQTLPEIINRVSGIEINGSRSYQGQNLGYYVRGGRNREVVIMVDGVQLNDPSSIANDFDLRLLSINQIESIEIIKGAASTLYGSGAATAVINITTKAPRENKVNLQVQSLIGSNNTQKNQDYTPATFDNSVSLNGRISGFDYMFNYSHKYADNISAIKSLDEDLEFEDDSFKRDNLYARLGYTFNDKLKFHFFGNFDQFNSNYDDAFMYLDADNALKSEQFRTGSHWVANYNKNGSFIFSDSYTEAKREVVSDFPNKYDSKLYSFDAHNKYVFFNKLHTVLGVNGMFSEFNSFNVPFGEEGFVQTVDADVAKFSIVDPYLNMVYTAANGLNLNVGARLNIHSNYDNYLVYNINPSYTHQLDNSYIKIMSSYSTAYITPSLFQLYAPQFGNENLMPEESETLEGGIEFKAENFRVSGTYFKRTSTNFIDFVTIDPETFTSEYRNVNEEFTADGFEFEVSYALNNLNFSGNYTFTNPAERFTLRIPKHKVNAILGYQISDKTFTSLNYQYNYERTDSFYNSESFQNELVVLDSYGVLDFNVSHHLNNHLQFVAGITNIFNTEFEELFMFNTRGRNVHAGVNLNF